MLLGREGIVCDGGAPEPAAQEIPGTPWQGAKVRALGRARDWRHDVREVRRPGERTLPRGRLGGSANAKPPEIRDCSRGFAIGRGASGDARKSDQLKGGNRKEVGWAGMWAIHALLRNKFIFAGRQ